MQQHDHWAASGRAGSPETMQRQPTINHHTAPRCMLVHSSPCNPCRDDSQEMPNTEVCCACSTGVVPQWQQPYPDPCSLFTSQWTWKLENWQSITSSAPEIKFWAHVKQHLLAEHHVIRSWNKNWSSCEATKAIPALHISEIQETLTC
jgi:hypothetical protein